MLAFPFPGARAGGGTGWWATPPPAPAVPGLRGEAAGRESCTGWGIFRRGRLFPWAAFLSCLLGFSEPRGDAWCFKSSCFALVAYEKWSRMKSGNGTLGSKRSLKPLVTEDVAWVGSLNAPQPQRCFSNVSVRKRAFTEGRAGLLAGWKKQLSGVTQTVLFH